MSGYFDSEQNDAKEYASRFKFLYLILALAGGIVFSRLWYLQITKGQELRSYSEKNRIKEKEIPAPRGFILDRNHETLVENLPGFNVTISPQYAVKLTETAQAIEPILNIPSTKIISLVKKGKYQDGPFREVLIKENLSLDEVYRLKLLRFYHPGLNINQTIVRHYPLGINGAQLFGYVGEISKEQIDEFNSSDTLTPLKQGDIIGKRGLELVWDSQIRGRSGLSYLEVDAKGRETNSKIPGFLGLKKQQANPGNNLVLTIDKDVQKTAEESMNRKDQIGPRLGSVVAMKTDGEILAWYNSPSFDPNEFSRGISNDLWKNLINDPYKPLRNKVIQDHYSPGSTFKPFVAIAALETGIISPNTIVYAPGSIKFGNRVYHDHNRAGEGNISVREAIERSSNVFFYKMGIQLGIDTIYKYASMLGIGELTHIHLNNEVPGLMPNSEWKQKTFGEAWQPGENLSAAIGQGYVLTTTLQMAVAYNAIGTEGKVYKPFLVKELLDSKDHVIKKYEPELVRDIGDSKYPSYIHKSTFETVKEGLRLVANAPHGTAHWWKIPGIEIAGKTGTTQVKSFAADDIYSLCVKRPFDDRHHGWFVSFAPAKNPLITVAVMTLHSCHGSTGSAPIARDIMKTFFEKYHPELITQKSLKKPNEPREQLGLKETVNE